MNEEKKLTDEEIVKALEFCAKDSSCLWDSKCPLRNDKDCHVTLSKAALAFINRQNKDYIELDLEARELRTELDKELAEHEEFTKKAKAEIERLAKVEMDLIGKIADKSAEIERLTRELDDTISMNEMYIKKVEENAELQKQVEKLTEENGWLSKECNKTTAECVELQKQVDELKAFKNEAISMSLYGKGRKDGEEVAVKDTAKKILITTIQLSDMCESFYEFQNRLIDLVEVNYGIESELKTIIPTNGVEVE